MLLSKNTTLGILAAVLASGGTPAARGQEAIPAPQHRIYEALPPNIAQSTNSHLNQVIKASLTLSTMAPYYIIVQQTRRWKSGGTVTIAFNGGTDDLYAKIENAATTWTQAGAANLKMSFKDSAGNYLHWSTTDKAYSADIRIGFVSGNGGGYWSVIGIDSRDTTVQGGSPNQASMNLDSFDTQLPSDWAAVVQHEFGHALGFEHEHQSPNGDCDFRFADDPGYVKTTDSDGWYTTDSKGRRPGLYTFLGGKANYWSAATVDVNMKSLTLAATQNFLLGPFDDLSIMKYYIDPTMLSAGKSSPCYSSQENVTLSAQDIVGVHKAYSNDTTAASKSADTIKALLKAPRISAELKSSLSQRLNTIQRQDSP